MAEAFVRTLKRDYVRVDPRPNAQSVIDQLPAWFAHYNEVHPHRALRYRLSREFFAQTCGTLSGHLGATSTNDRKRFAGAIEGCSSAKADAIDKTVMRGKVAAITTPIPGRSWE